MRGCIPIPVGRCILTHYSISLVWQDPLAGWFESKTNFPDSPGKRYFTLCLNASDWIFQICFFKNQLWSLVQNETFLSYRRRKRHINNDLHQDDESVAFPPIKWKTDKASRLLFLKGHDDKSTIAIVTIAIKVMKSYHRTMPVFSAYGMPLISAYLIKVTFGLLYLSNTFETEVWISRLYNISLIWVQVSLDLIWNVLFWIQKKISHLEQLYWNVK